MDKRTVRICKAGDHLSFKISKQILPNLSVPPYLLFTSARSIENGRREEKSTDVWVIDFSEESDFGRSHRIIFR